MSSNADMTGTSSSNLFTSRRSAFATLLFSLATFNIRGLGCRDDETLYSKREQLGADCKSYNVDICALQETKVTESCDQMLSNGYRLVCFGQTQGRHYGQGFVLSPWFLNSVNQLTFQYISDRVCIVDFELPSRSGTAIRCRAINVYGPHRKLTNDDPQQLENFYSQLRSTMKVSSNVEIFIMGDFNSKLGKLTDNDRSYGLNSFIGSHGIGSRNDMGEHLLDFLSEYDMLATNTCFQHSARHKTTYTAWRKGWSKGRNTKHTIPVYAQLDYILCKSRSRSLLQNSRSYAGTQTCSDHRIVITRINFGNTPLCFKKNFSSNVRYNISELTSNIELQEKYHSTLDCSIASLPSTSTPNDDLNQLLKTIKESAASTIGVSSKRARHHSDDDEIKELSQKRHLLRQQLNSNMSADRSSLKLLEHLSTDYPTA